MDRKYRKFFIVAALIHAICLYYSLVFCSIYSSSVIGWFNGCVISLFIDLGIISIGIPLIKTLVRVIIRNFPLLRFLIIIDYSFFLLNFVL